jgi:prepilin-type N-terminal cleavage/methylation domain-containing protein
MMRRRGFSLIELLIAMVMVGIVGAGLVRMLQSQMRFFQRSAGAADARSVSRNAINIMRNEFRMVEPGGVTAASPTSITVWLPYRMGIFCSNSSGTFMPVDSLIGATAIIQGYASRSIVGSGAWTYVATTTAPATGTSTDCTGAPAIALIPDGEVLSLTPALASTSGTPLMLYQTVTYSLAASALAPGRTALWRTVTGGASEELAVPFDAASAFRYYVGTATSQAAAPATLSTISGIEMVLLGESERNSPGTNAPETQTTRVSIFLRNAVQ